MYSIHDIQRYADQLNIPDEFIPKNKLNSYPIDLTLFGSEGNTGYPEVEIVLNKKILYQGIINQEQVFHFDIDPLKTRQLFSIRFLNKTDHDTEIVNDRITKDKFVQIKKLLINNLYLEPIKYFKYYPTYTQGYIDYNPNPEKILYTDFLAFNGVLKIYFELPVLSYFAKSYFKNSEYLKQKNKLTADSFGNLANLFKGIKSS